MNERLNQEYSALNEQILVLTDENKTLMRKVETHESTISKLNKKVSKYKNLNGVPSSHVKKLEDALEKSQKEIEALKFQISKYETAASSDKRMISQLEQEKVQLSGYLSRKEKDEAKYKKMLKDKTKQEKKLVFACVFIYRFEKEMLKLDERVKVAEDVNKVKEENEALIAQKNVLLKFKESIGREVEKLKADTDRKTKLIEQKDAEFDKYRKDAEEIIERLKSANERLSHENMELENENMAMQKEQRTIVKQLNRLSNAATSDPRLSNREEEDYKRNY